MESQKHIVMLSIAFALLVALSVANPSFGDKPATSPSNGSGSGSGSSLVPTIPPSAMSNEDEVNGDDGAAIRKDLEDLNKTASNTDNHQFYKPEYIKEPERAMAHWVNFSAMPSSQSMSSRHEMLSKSYRRAAPIRLTFDFPFYGQPLRNIIVATGGFLYVGEHIHHWLAATQNISPLMANFDLSMNNYSDIYHYDNGSSLVVQWSDVQMKDNKPPGNFSFQVTLHKNGDIVFVYKSLPVPINEIPEVEHPVKVGISDAFLIDKVAFFIRRKTIYDYHRLNLKDVPEIKSQSAIYLKALPTCSQYDTCDACSKAIPSLECVWCPAVKRCSNGFDRKRQEWLSNHCDKLSKTDCSARPEASAAAASSSSSSSSSLAPTASNSQQSPSIISVEPSSTSSRQMLIPDRGGDSRASEGGTAFVTFLMFVALTSGVALWAFYAYRNPHTPSGQMLIKYRPGNWRWQNAETRYTAASIHM